MTKLKDMKVLIAELLADSAVEKIQSVCKADIRYNLSREELLKAIPEYDAIIIRSETKVDKEFLDAAVNLKIVGRAGSGLDNIDIPYATEKGVVAANTPESNIVSAAEHTMALLLATSRNVVWANNFIKSGKWDRKRFRGSEVYNKTVAIIGLGRIGGLIAERVAGFSPKKVIAYDPYISDSRFDKYGVEKKETLEELLAEADFITVHTPRTEETINIISHKELPLMKDGVRLVNVARGGLFNEDAMAEGLKSGKIASVGIDVWMNEPQTEHAVYEFESAIGTPHLGASTFEAQVRVGEEVVNEVIAGLKGEMVKNAVNIPSVSETTFKKLSAYIDLAEKMGKLYSGINKTAIKKIEISFAGKDISEKEDVKLLSLVGMKSILDASVPGTVNFVNASLVAAEKGIELKESIEFETKDYNNLITIKVTKENGEIFEIAGTVLDGKLPRIVKLGGYEMDLVPEGKIIFAPHKNVPGVVGKLGIAMAKYNVNILKMIVSNGDEGSIMVMEVENNVPEALVNEIKEFDEINDIKVVEL